MSICPTGRCDIKTVRSQSKYLNVWKQGMGISFVEPRGYTMMTSSNGNIFRVTSHLYGEFRWIPTQGAVTRSFDVIFALRLNKRLSKQWWGWWIERPLWRHLNAYKLRSVQNACMSGTCHKTMGRILSANHRYDMRKIWITSTFLYENN